VAKILTGTFAFRFQGYTVFRPKPRSPVLTLFMVGVGLMKIDHEGKVEGRQDSTTTPIGSTRIDKGFPLSCKYRLEGRYNSVTGTARIHFIPSRECPDCADEHASFDIVRAGADRFWIISRKAIADGMSANELCSGEAVRIGGLSDDDLKLPASPKIADPSGRGKQQHRG